MVPRNIAHAKPACRRQFDPKAPPDNRRGRPAVVLTSASIAVGIPYLESTSSFSHFWSGDREQTTLNSRAMCDKMNPINLKTNETDSCHPGALELATQYIASIEGNASKNKSSLMRANRCPGSKTIAPARQVLQEFQSHLWPLSGSPNRVEVIDEANELLTTPFLSKSKLFLMHRQLGAKVGIHASGANSAICSALTDSELHAAPKGARVSLNKIRDADEVRELRRAL